MPTSKIPLRAKISQGRVGQWKIRVVYTPDLSGLEIPEGHTAWILEPDRYSEIQAGLQGTEVTTPDEPVVLLWLRAKPRDGNTGSSAEPSDGVTIWIA
ncbi:MAG TPA: hypothetical protein VFI31_16515 [Pirellulales bacterium]|nr:hypothetical protein [Pirellulales bacterium]